jgi:hypothetical protein
MLASGADQWRWALAEEGVELREAESRRRVLVLVCLLAGRPSRGGGKPPGPAVYDLGALEKLQREADRLDTVGPTRTSRSTPAVTRIGIRGEAELAGWLAGFRDNPRVTAGGRFHPLRRGGR